MDDIALALALALRAVHRFLVAALARVARATRARAAGVRPPVVKHLKQRRTHVLVLHIILFCLPHPLRHTAARTPRHRHRRSVLPAFPAVSFAHLAPAVLARALARKLLGSCQEVAWHVVAHVVGQ